MCICGTAFLIGAENVAVIELGKIVRQSALNADFGRAELPGFHGFARHIVESVEIGVGLARPAAEGAELASHETDVGEIDVAVHHIGDDVARRVRHVASSRRPASREDRPLPRWPGRTTHPATARRHFAFRESSLRKRAAPEPGVARCQTSRAKGKMQVRNRQSRGSRCSPWVQCSSICAEPQKRVICDMTGDATSNAISDVTGNAIKNAVILKPSEAGLRDRTTDESPMLWMGTPISHAPR